MTPDAMARELASRLDLTTRPRSWSGDCPECSYPRAFSIRVGKGPRPTLYCANGCPREALDEAVVRVLGDDWRPLPAPDTAREAATREAKQARALRLLDGASVCQAGDPAGRYLARRGLAHLIGCPALRTREDCRHPEQGRFHALVAAVQDASGRPIACHRTYLTRDGHKANVDPVKASLGPVWGGSIRLAPVAAELVIGEGIETAASAGLLLNLPAWAAISAGNLAAGLVLPAEVRAVVIAADPDGPGLEAARKAALRWTKEGRLVRVATPNTAGQDFNDLLQTRLASGRPPHG